MRNIVIDVSKYIKIGYNPFRTVFYYTEIPLKMKETIEDLDKNGDKVIDIEGKFYI